MDLLKNIDRPTKAILGASLLLIVYGYLCRAVDLYFFWESLTIGWELCLIGLIYFFKELIKSKKRKQKRYIWEGIGVCVLLFVLVVQSIFYIVIPNTDAYAAAKKFVLNNDSLKSEIGNITSFGAIPAGNISVSSNSQGESGEAQINLLVKGEKKFKDLKLYMNKQIGSNWKVTSLQ